MDLWITLYLFPAPVPTDPMAHPASYAMLTISLSQGLKRPGRGVDNPPTIQHRG